MYLQSSALKRYAQKLKQQNRNSNMHKQNKSRSPNHSIISVDKSNQTNNRRYKTVPSDQDTISQQQRGVSQKYYNSRMQLHSLQTIVLPRLQQQIAKQEKKALNQIYKHRNKITSNIPKKKYQLLPLKKLEPVRLMKRSSSSNSGVSYLSMSSSGRKLTDQYFSQINNIRLVQKLLLVRPTKQNSKIQHQQFYQQQQRYKKNIQLSKSVPFKRKKEGFKNKPWANI